MTQLARMIFSALVVAALFGCPPQPDVEPPEPTEPLDPKMTAGGEAMAGPREEEP